MVTRPAHQAARLSALIRTAGGTPVAFPVLEIAALTDARAARALLARLTDIDIALFISANAVEHAAPLIAAGGVLPADLRLAAVGQRTAAALRERYGRADITAPPPYNSEALLATPALQAVKGLRILIVRGEGGRELLAEQLRARGADVQYAEVYRRLEPDHTLDEVARLHPDIAVIVVTSNDGLRNLLHMAAPDQMSWLLDKQLAVISPRTAELAAALGFTRPALVARAATDEALLEALVGWRATGITKPGSEDPS